MDMQSGVRIGRVLGFIFSTLGLTWGIHWFTAQHLGGEAFLNQALPPLGMLIPGFVALVIEVFISKESRLHFRKFKEHPRLIFYAFMLMTITAGVITALGLFTRVPIYLLSALGEILFVSWTLFGIYLYRQCGEESFRLAGLQLGDKEKGIPFVIVSLGVLSGIYVLNIAAPEITATNDWDEIWQTYTDEFHENNKP